MSRREVKKELMKFVRREVKEKGTEWGELRRIKRQIVIKKGLPNVPSLVLKSDSGLSYIALIHSKKELRLYLFDIEGKIIHGQSYFQVHHNLEDVYKDICAKSKKVARYPPAEKSVTRAQQDYQLDRRFQRLWVKLAKKLMISKSHRRKRPLIKGINKEAKGIFGTLPGKDFIQVPYQSPHLGNIFAYYSIYYFLPSPIRQNEDLAEALALKILISFKKYKNTPIMQNRNSFEILNKLDPWNTLELTDLFNILYKVSLYYDFPWKTQDFIIFINLPLNLVKMSSRHFLPNLFGQLFSNSQNMNFLTLACFLGIPFDLNYHIPPEISNKVSILLCNWLKTWQFSKILPVLQQKRIQFSPGQIKAIEEALHFQYSNVLHIDLNKNGVFKVKNKSDIRIILTSVVEILPDGIETEITFQPVTLNANSTISFDLNSLNVKDKFPLRIQYSLVNSPEDISRPIFIGTLVI